MFNTSRLVEALFDPSATWTPQTTWKRNLAAIVVIIVIGVCGGIIAGRTREGEILLEQREEYLHNQELCEAQEGWYVHSEDYHGLISCHYWPNETYEVEERFWMVPSTGLVLYDETMLPD